MGFGSNASDFVSQGVGFGFRLAVDAEWLCGSIFSAGSVAIVLCAGRFDICRCVFVMLILQWRRDLRLLRKCSGTLSKCSEMIVLFVLRI